MENNIQIYLTNGIDASLVGFELGGWKVRTIHEIPVEQDGLTADSKHPQRILGISTFYPDYYVFGENPCCFYFEKRSVSPFDIGPVIDACRLLKPSQIGLYYPISANAAGGCIVNALSAYAYENKNHIDGLETFSLTETEHTALWELYQKLLEPQSDSVKRMLELFHEAYRTENPDIAFILRITVLEMLIEGNAELSFRLSRSVAVLLGKSRDESLDIFDKCKKMYSARSTFLHDGSARKIKKEHRLLVLDYSRRVISNLLNKDLKEVRETLEICGFGDNPYNVDF